MTHYCLLSLPLSLPARAWSSVFALNSWTQNWLNRRSNFEQPKVSRLYHECQAKYVFIVIIFHVWALFSCNVWPMISGAENIHFFYQKIIETLYGLLPDHTCTLTLNVKIVPLRGYALRVSDGYQSNHWRDRYSSITRTFFEYALLTNGNMPV